MSQEKNEKSEGLFTEEWLTKWSKLWYIHTIKYYVAVFYNFYLLI